MKLTRVDKKAADFAIDRLEEIEARANELRDDYNNISAASLKKAERMIPKGGGMAALVADLELLAAKNGMRLKSMDFGMPVISGETAIGEDGDAAGNEFNVRRGAYTLPLSIQVAGKYDSFRRFVAEVELHERLIDILTVNFAASEKDDAAFSIRANVYYQ